jgi:hypothetical protein
VKLSAATEPAATFALVLRNGRRIESTGEFCGADLARLIRLSSFISLLLARDAEEAYDEHQWKGVYALLPHCVQPLKEDLAKEEGNNLRALLEVHRRGIESADLEDRIERLERELEHKDRL